jgi:hypothetical protein
MKAVFLVTEYVVPEGIRHSETIQVSLARPKHAIHDRKEVGFFLFFM